MTFQWMPQDTWIIVIAVLATMSCALLGNFLVLRRMSMMGDAISHAVLPGLALAFIFTGSRDSVIMFIGAGIVGILTAVFTQWIHSIGKVEQSASMGVVFTSLFAVGLILMVLAADHIDLDPGCVLYGAIENAAQNMTTVLGFTMPRAAVSLGIVFLINLSIVVVLFKELRISSFDPGLATTLGINAQFMHYLLMTLVAVTTVASFEAVGSILVIAMLIVPAAAAHLCTNRLHTMVIVSLIFGAASAALGHISAITVPQLFGYPDTRTAGMMAVTAGAIFFGALVFAPQHGMVARWRNRIAIGRRIVREDVLGLLYRYEELQTAATQPALEADNVTQALSRPGRSIRLALRELVRHDQLEHRTDGYGLTATGRRHAQRLVRVHRLWESYLHRHLNLPAKHQHTTAERLEHVTNADMQHRLAERTDQPTTDPQGKRIPPE